LRQPNSFNGIDAARRLWHPDSVVVVVLALALSPSQLKSAPGARKQQQQQQQQNTEFIGKRLNTMITTANPATSFWNGQMAKYPALAGWLALARQTVGFFTGGQFIVAFGHWLVTFCGRIAETAMLLSVLWITSVFIAPSFVLWLLQQVGGDLDTLNVVSDFAIMALALLPEVIVFNALVTCIRFWFLAFSTKGKRLQYGAWAALHTMPTLAFLGMTIWTMWTFIHGHAHLDQAAIDLIENARSQGLTIRVFAGWFFCLTSVVYARLGKETHAQLADAPPPSAPANPAPPAHADDIAKIKEQVEVMTAQMLTMQNMVQSLQQSMTIPSQSSLRKKTEKPAATHDQATAPDDENGPTTGPIMMPTYPSESTLDEAGSDYASLHAHYAHLLAQYPMIGDLIASGEASMTPEQLVAATSYSRQLVAAHKKQFRRVAAKDERYTIASILAWLDTIAPKQQRAASSNGHHHGDQHAMPQTPLPLLIEAGAVN
jgi:hypothetical protein